MLKLPNALADSEHDIDKLIERTEKEGDQVESEVSANQAFSFAKIWSADKDELEEIQDDVNGDQLDSWAQTLERIAAERIKTQTAEMTGRGVRRKAAAVFPQVCDLLTDSKYYSRSLHSKTSVQKSGMLLLRMAKNLPKARAKGRSPSLSSLKIQTHTPSLEVLLTATAVSTIRCPCKVTISLQNSFRNGGPKQTRLRGKLHWLWVEKVYSHYHPFRTRTTLAADCVGATSATNHAL